jgi:hypothetical protein
MSMIVLLPPRSSKAEDRPDCLDGLIFYYECKKLYSKVLCRRPGRGNFYRLPKLDPVKNGCFIQSPEWLVFRDNLKYLHLVHVQLTGILNDCSYLLYIKKRGKFCF